MDNEKILIGHKINAIKIASDKQAILFDTDKGEVIADADADCCSYTWIEHIELPALGFPATVIDCMDLAMPQVEGGPDSECLQCYGFKIVTDRGEIVIDYRNESNGYYGGSLSWPGSHHYGGVYGQNNSKHEWVDVTLSAKGR